MSLPVTLLKTGIRISLILVPGILAQGCESFKQVEACDFETDAIENFSKTNLQGVIQPGAKDADDWRVSPVYSQNVSVSPAFPNPARISIIYLSLVIYNSAGETLTDLDIIAKDSNGNWVSLIPPLGRAKSTPGTGTWTLPVELSRLSAQGTLGSVAGLHRIYLVKYPMATDFCNDLISYGDIYISP